MKNESEEPRPGAQKSAIKSSRVPPVIIVLRVLWRMLDSAKRAFFVFLVALVFVAAILEMGSMVVLFGYVKGLEPSPEGLRGGHLALLLERAYGQSLPQIDYVLVGGAIVFGYTMLKNLMSMSVRFGLNRFLAKINQRMSEQLYRSYMLAPYEIFLKRGFQGPVKEIGSLSSLFHSCFSALVHILSGGSILLAVLGLLFYLDFRLTILTIVIFTSVGVGLYSLLQRRLGVMGKQQEAADKRVGQFLHDGLQGVIEVRLRGTKNYFFSGYSGALGRAAVLRRRKDAMATLPRSGNELALSTLIVGSTLYLALQHQTVADALPTLGVFGFAGLRMNGVLSRINVAAQTLKRRAVQFDEAYERLKEAVPAAIGLTGPGEENYLTDEKPFPEGVDGKFHRRLLLKKVSFSYPRSTKKPVPVLRKLSFAIEKGSFVAICGPSGGGKTTLLLLIMGILRPTSGQIFCDDWPVFEHIRAWHKNIGYVSQAAFLVAGTIRDNVAFGIEPKDVEDEKVWAALRLASAAEFVRALPRGLDTELKDAGFNLSGGQRQRLNIARALYDDPEIVILDEATAALDNITEREVTDAIANLGGKKTIICVAHRLTTIRNSDRIYFLKDSRVEAQGTYEELLASCPSFAEMVAAGNGESSVSSTATVG